MPSKWHINKMNTKSSYLFLTSSWCANGVLHQTAGALSNSRIWGSLYRYCSCHDLAGQISPFGEAHCRGGWTPFTTHAADSTLSLAHYDWLLIGKVVKMLTSAYKYRKYLCFRRGKRWRFYHRQGCLSCFVEPPSDINRCRNAISLKEIALIFFWINILLIAI